MGTVCWPRGLCEHSCNTPQQNSGTGLTERRLYCSSKKSPMNLMFLRKESWPMTLNNHQPYCFMFCPQIVTSQLKILAFPLSHQTLLDLRGSLAKWSQSIDQVCIQSFTKQEHHITANNHQKIFWKIRFNIW